MRRNDLLAYLIGAGVAGSVLVVPYTGWSIGSTVLPAGYLPRVPFFLLPIAWGLWNWLRARLGPPCSTGAWGAALGILLGGGVNLILLATGGWFAAAALLLLFLPAAYYLIWQFVVGPLNDALGADA